MTDTDCEEPWNELHIAIVQEDIDEVHHIIRHERSFVNTQTLVRFPFKKKKKSVFSSVSDIERLFLPASFFFVLLFDSQETQRCTLRS